MDIDTPVLVLRLDHYEALGVFRSLGRLGVATYGLHRTADALALRSRYLRAGILWDLDAEPAARSVERLLELADALGGRPILLPTNDETALFVAAHAVALRSAFRFPDNPRALVEGLYNKRTMSRLAREHDIPTAETHFPRSLDEVRAFAETARFPVMLKGSDGIRLSLRTGEKMRIIHSPTELLEEYRRMEDFAEPDLMLQEYIPGGEDAQWMWNGYFDARSRCLFGITGRKLRQTPPYTGMTSLGVCERNDEVDSLTRRFMNAIGYRGILDIGYRFDARDGKYKVLDVNPRLGATFRLFVGAGGLDVVRALYLDLTGQPVPSSAPCPGRKWFVEELDLASSVRYRRDGRLAVRDWLRSFGGVRESAWFARDDVRPFAGMCTRVFAQALRKAGQQVGVLSPHHKQAPTEHQAKVTRHFTQNALAWQRVYQLERLEPRMIRERHELALRWVESLPLSPPARVLEVGCGAGHAAVALASRGFQVHAVDAAPEMVELAARAARAAGVPHMTTALGDVHALELDSGRFDLVIALGVLPWLHAEERALREMARVLVAGGWLIATADNRRPLHRLIDPAATPPLAPLRVVAKRLLRRNGATYDGPFAKTHDARRVEELLRSAELETVKRSSVGFGPFWLCGRKLFSENADLAIHARLQRLAELEWPILRSTGVHHVILARKRTSSCARHPTDRPR
jgi:predicted ATP-grasp superfamily ATP-dependent carboligase/ubiquinone/menaquinone biosynthesis C-methylase UbiE